MRGRTIIPASRRMIGRHSGDTDLMIRTSRTTVAVALLSMTLVLTACGGGATGTTARDATPTPATDATPIAGADATPDLGAAIPSFDLSALTGALPGVDSYRTSFSTGGTTNYESIVVTKPEISKAITTYNDDGTVSNRIIVIGKQAWMADGADGTFEAVPDALAGSVLMAFDPAMMLGAYASMDWAGAAADQGTEEKNGVQARHLKIDPTTMVGAAAGMPAGASIDVWVADAGYLVAWEMSGFEEGQDLSIQVTGVNDPANVVEAPAP
jgi:hypothetical protein